MKTYKHATLNMPRQISDEQIALARQYFNSGHSLPEIALMTKMSLASAKKHLSKEIEALLIEQAEIEAKPIEQTNEADPIEQTDESKPKAEPESSIELNATQFKTYIDFEFKQIRDRIKLNDLYYELQEQYKDNGDKLIVLRQAYDARLSKFAEPIANSNNVLIKQLAKQLGIKIAIHKSGKYGNTNAFDKERLLGHIVWWIDYANKQGKLAMPLEEAMQIVQTKFKEYYEQ